MILRWLLSKEATAKTETTESESGATVPKPRRARSRRRQIGIWFVILMHVLGAITSIQAVMSTRTSQGAIAWAIGLNTVPYVAVPAYWVLGQSRFDGYHLLRHSEYLRESKTAFEAEQKLIDKGLLLVPRNEIERSHHLLLDKISRLPITTGNSAKLLVDGEQTFDAILNAISTAKDYILVQFYIIRDDELGTQLKEALLLASGRGVRVHVLYDELGSKDLSKTYIDDLKIHGIEIVPFNQFPEEG